MHLAEALAEFSVSDFMSAAGDREQLDRLTMDWITQTKLCPMDTDLGIDDALLPEKVAEQPGAAARLAQLVLLHLLVRESRSAPEDLKAAGAWLERNNVSKDHQRWQSQTMGLQTRSSMLTLDYFLDTLKQSESSSGSFFALLCYGGQIRANFRFAEMTAWSRATEEADCDLEKDDLTIALAWTNNTPTDAKSPRADTLFRKETESLWEALDDTTARYTVINSVYGARSFAGQGNLLTELVNDFERAASRKSNVRDLLDCYGWGPGRDGVMQSYKARGYRLEASGSSVESQKQKRDVEELLGRAEETADRALRSLPLGDPATDITLFQEQIGRERDLCHIEGDLVEARATASRVEHAAEKAEGAAMRLFEVLGIFAGLLIFAIGSVQLSGTLLKTQPFWAVWGAIAIFGTFLIGFALVLKLVRPREPFRRRK